MRKVLSLLFVLILPLSSLALEKVEGGFYKPEISIPNDLSLAGDAFLGFVNRQDEQGLNPTNCVQKLGAIYQSVYTLSPNHFLGKEYRNGNIEKLKSIDESNPLRKFFLARIALRKKFSGWVKNSQFNSYEDLQACGDSMKVIMRTLRTFEDYYGQLLLEETGFLSKGKDHAQQKTKKFAGNIFPHAMINPKYSDGFYFPQSKDDKHGTLKTGDILLSRGTAFTSAVISRIGSVDNQFSHLAIVYIADGSIKEYLSRDKEIVPFEKGKIYILESVLDNGLQVITMDQYLADDKARLAYFRYVGNGKLSDDELQNLRKTAAQKLAVKAASGNSKYNFSMDMANNNELFCSQAVSHAYEMACNELGINCQMDTPLASKDNTGHSYPFPILTTLFKKDNQGEYINQLATMLELKSVQVFAPADVEMEPQIELIGEWRQYKHIAGRRIHDMVFTKIMQWMEVKGYKFKEDSPVVDDASIFGQILASTFEKMPPETPEGFVKGTMFTAYMVKTPGLNKIGKGIARKAMETQTVKRLTERLDDANQAQMFLEIITNVIAPVALNGQGNELLPNLDEMDTQEIMERAQYLKELIESGRLVDIVSFKGLEKEMNDFREGYIKKRGFPPTDFIYDRFLEKYRVRSCQAFIDEQTDFFHHMFAKSFSGLRSQACDTEELDWRYQW